MTVNELIEKIKSTPQDIDFDVVIATIDSNYDYTPTRFRNGMAENAVTNEAGSNEGSCKIFAFGLLNKLDKKQTLACFGRFYRVDVLQHPDNEDHSNIRRFMQHGRDGIAFDTVALALK